MSADVATPYHFTGFASGAKLRTMTLAAELDALHRTVETALGRFQRAQEMHDAAVAANARSQALIAELAATRKQLSLATKVYKEAVLAVMAQHQTDGL